MEEGSISGRRISNDMGSKQVSCALMTRTLLITSKWLYGMAQVSEIVRDCQAVPLDATKMKLVHWTGEAEYKFKQSVKAILK